MDVVQPEPSSLDFTAPQPALLSALHIEEMGNKVSGYEKWDDGNLLPNDGCDENWLIELGMYCENGTISTPDAWHSVWGDEIRIHDEEWDDGNIVIGDGWSKTCKIEDGYTWNRASSSSPDIWVDIWGDGRVFDPSNTFWDDGNTIDGDGCSHNWVIETGWVCSEGSKTAKDKWLTVWGDGVLVQSQEEWDDGNIVNGDGCNSKWKIEQYWYWNIDFSQNPDSTWSEYCGDGRNLKIRQWDDGNLVDGDGCNSSCDVEVGYNWVGGSKLNSDVCKEVWGDGLDLGKKWMWRWK